MEPKNKRKPVGTRLVLGTLTSIMALAAMTAPAGAQVVVNPDGAGVPGAALMGNLINGLAQFALLASVGAVLVGAGFWGWSNYNDRAGGVNKGQKMILGGVLGAVMVGASALIVNTAYTAGTAG